jgi:ubiquinone/menaquinone biosynthesis C-methylase UbiE
MRTLSRTEARRFYDWIGSKLDTQAFLEDSATSELVKHVDLGSARSVFEFGCGTGRFAESLLAHHLSRTTTYHAIDISPVMVGLARQRLERFGPRANIRITDGHSSIDEPSESHDCFISNFVFDLLSEDDINNVIREAHRLLRPSGLLGLSSQTTAFTLPSRIFASVWNLIYTVQPVLVGGCRARELSNFLPPSDWNICHHARIIRLGIPLEAVVARRVESCDC